MNTRWLAPLAVALLSVGSGWSTTASAQNEAAENNKLVFAVVVKQIFNEGDLALVDDFMAKDVSNNGATLGRDGFKAMIRDLRTIVPDLKITVGDLVIQGDRVIARVTQTGDGASERRIILLRIDNGLVQEHWSWADEPGLVRPLGLRADRAPQSTASAN